VQPYEVLQHVPDHETFLKHIKSNKRTATGQKFQQMYHGQLVNMGSVRYHVFKHKGMHSVVCGLEGQFFILERHASGVLQDVYHFNLYNINNGALTMMTKDHILPVSHGGTNDLSNLQCMCEHCNQRKGNKTLSIEKMQKQLTKQQPLIQLPLVQEVTKDSYVSVQRSN
jgi:5-methylcytosine-specific restriction endonuclease McrA